MLTINRSSGAYALSIWTHALRNIEYHPQWRLPDGNGTENAIVTGSGNTWSVLYSLANQHNRIVVGGGDHSVGLGGYLQGGGHGPFSSQFGLGADQILQATVVTADGRVLVTNNVQNRDLFWAIKGGGAGQYGVVTEYVLKSHPAPSNVVTGSLSVYGARNASADEAWSAVTAVLSSIPDLMDSLPLAGTINIAAGVSGKSMVGANYTVPGAVIAPSFYGYNMTKAQLHTVLHSLATKAIAATNRTGSIIATLGAIESHPSFLAFFNSTNSSPSATVSSSLMSSRLLGRAELTDLPMPDLKRHLQNFVEGENGSMLLFGLQGGRGPRTVPSHLRGALNPVWRSVYAHVLSFGAPINATGVPSVELPNAGKWSETHREAYWRVWAPDTGAYMNEANTFNTHWKKDFYGVYYEELLGIKMKYDPGESLFVRNGVGSDRWDYDLDSGLLCRVD